jgi:hypothetical protein
VGSITPSLGRICYCQKSRRLNIAINDFPEIGIYGFEEDFENKEEDDDSKLAVFDPWIREEKYVSLGVKILSACDYVTIHVESHAVNKFYLRGTIFFVT